MLILFADDDFLSRSIFEAICEEEPAIELFIVKDGVEAWEALDKGLCPDLCVFDIHMPNMSGLELVKKIRADSRFEHLNVILITGAKDRGTVVEAASSNITSYIIKPVKKFAVLDKLRGFIQFLPPALGHKWIAEPRNFMRRNFLKLDVYTKEFNTIFDDLERIQALITSRSNDESKTIVTSCINRLIEIAPKLGFTKLTHVCSDVREMLSSIAPEEHERGLKVLTGEIQYMLRCRPSILNYLKELKSTDTIE